MPEPRRLADLDPIIITTDVMNVVYDRVCRDTRRIGLVARVADPGQDEKLTFATALGSSEAFRAALAVAEWATSGRGEAGEIPALLRHVRADLDGIDVKKASTRGPVDLETLPGVALVAAGARLALFEGRTVSAVELATLASIDEHSVRAAVKAGTLRPVGPGRPMRFAADLARAYLYTRGVPGFAAPQAPAP
jgi:hypothetical protein